MAVWGVKGKKTLFMPSRGPRLDVPRPEARVPGSFGSVLVRTKNMQLGEGCNASLYRRINNTCLLRFFLYVTKECRP